MGLLTYDALVLAKVAATIGHRGSILTLGVPTLNFRSEDFVRQLVDYPELEKRAPPSWKFDNQAGFFAGLGFSEIDALDISNYEGANIIGDLNDPDLGGRIGKTYDLIYDSGTIEHIFDAPTALRTLSDLIKVGGAIVHATPANGFMDHGLWQVSPDLFRTFYRAAGFTVLTSAVFVFAETPYAMRADRNIYREHGRKYIVEKFPEAIAVFAAVKRKQVSSVSIDMQDYYKSMHDDAVSEDVSSFFLEFGTRAPKPVDDPAPAAPPSALRSLCSAILRRMAS
jgi:hypothetical protein